MTAGSAGPGPAGRWQAHPSPGVVAQIDSLTAAATSVDGITPLSGHVLEALTQGLPGDAEDDPSQAFRVWLEPEIGGELPGFVVATATDPAELAVHPDRRGRGLGTTLVRIALDRQGGVWAHGDLPAARAIAARLGLRPGRVLLQMRRSLTTGELAEPDWPPGVTVRTFRPGADNEQFLGVNSRAFAWHPEQGRLDGVGLAAELAQEWFQADGFFLAVSQEPMGTTGAGPEKSADRVLGFHWTKVHPADSAAGAGPVGEVYVLGVDPQSPIRRLGLPLTLTGLRHLRDRGLTEVILYVEQDNAPAVALYRRLGFEVSRRDVVYRR